MRRATPEYKVILRVYAKKVAKSTWVNCQGKARVGISRRNLRVAQLAPGPEPVDAARSNALASCFMERRLQLMQGTILAVAVIIAAWPSSALPCDVSPVEPFVIRNSNDVIELAEAVNCSGGTFSVDWVNHVESVETIRIFGGTVMNISGEIDGNSVVDGERRGSLFHIEGSTLHLSNLMVIDAVGDFGGAIEAFDSFITATNCVFSNNAGLVGGGLYLSNSSMEIQESTFANNSAIGGAIHALNSSVVIGDNVVFAHNTAPSEWYAGAIFSQDSIVSIPGSGLFIGNSADYGGAVLVIGGDLVIDGHALFADNNATYYGGGLYGWDAVITIAGAATWEGNEAGSIAGGLLLDTCEFNAYGSVFSSNWAAAAGGGVAAFNSTLEYVGDTVFANNSAQGEEGWGGAIFTSESNTTIFGNTTFADNEADSGAGAFMASGRFIIYGKVLFVDNYAGDHGGGLYGETLSVIIHGSAAWEGNVAVYGGGIFLFHTCEIIALGSVAFARNEADQGGGIWISYYTELEILGSALFESNTAREGGACVVFDSDARFGGNATCFNNTATTGGCLEVWGTGRIFFTGETNLSSNTATERGGGVTMLEGSSGFFKGSVLMVGNKAYGSGGALYAEAAASVSGLIVEGVHFISNRAGADGGAIALLSVGVKGNYSQILGCDFEDNEADNTGGALFVAGGFTDVINSTFFENTAGELSSLYEHGRTPLY